MLLKTAIPGCHLRPWRGDDKPALVRHANNANVWRNLGEIFPHPYTEADADTWLAFAAQPKTGIHFAIEFQGEAVGGIGATPREGIGCQTGHFGYWLGETQWGKGIATAAARATVAHVFLETNLARLEAPVIAWNPASMRVLEKVGFVREGVLRRSVFKDGQLTDSVIYALLRESV